jgi:hypothetical protein
MSRQSHVTNTKHQNILLEDVSMQGSKINFLV